MKFFCETFSRMDITFRDESNESSSIMIDYSDAIVIVPNHSLIMRLKPLLATAHTKVP